MRHGISQQEWLDFLDHTLAPSKEARLRAHLATCGPCHELWQGLQEWRELMMEEGWRLRDSVQYTGPQIDLLLARTLERIRAMAATPVSSTWSALEAMILLRSLMTPICGAGAARATMDLALERSNFGPGERVNHQNWRRFVSNLSDVFASICGVEAGCLIDRAGLSLSIEQGCL